MIALGRVAMTPRVLITVACSYLSIPIAVQFAWAIGRHGEFGFPALSAILYCSCAVGAYRRWPPTRQILLLYAVALALLAVLFTFATPLGIAGLLSSVHPQKTDGIFGAASFIAQAMFMAIWLDAAWAAILATVAMRYLRETAVATTVTKLENRAIFIGIGLVCAWSVIAPMATAAVAPVRTVLPGVLASDAARARISLSDAQRRTLSPENLRTVDEMNVGLEELLAGKPTTNLERPRSYGESDWYKATHGTHEFIVYRKADGQIRQITFIIHRDHNGELARLRLSRTFLIE